MSVLLNFAIFPTDKGISVGNYVSLVLKNIDNKNFSYSLTAMGTIVETETLSEALNLINESYSILESYSERVYITASLDIRKNKNNRISDKVNSVISKLGK